MLELNTCCLIGMMFWVKGEASKCLSNTVSESSTALPLSFSRQCLCISNWLGLEVYCIFSLCCAQKVPHQRQIPYLPSASLFLSLSLSVSSLHEISSLSFLFPSHIHSERYIFIVTPQGPQSSQDIDLPYFFLHPCSVGGQFPLWKHQQGDRKHACIKTKKSTAPDQSSFILSQPPWSGGNQDWHCVQALGASRDILVSDLLPHSKMKDLGKASSLQTRPSSSPFLPKGGIS